MTDHEMELVFDFMGVRMRGFTKNKSVKCPLAPFTHQRGRDKNPSVTAKAGDPALYRCWACGHQGTVKKLARTYGDFTGDYRAYEYACSVEGGTYNPWEKLSNSKNRYGERFKYLGKQITDSLPRIITEEELKKYMAKVPKYAVDRGLTVEEIEKWEIGYDEKAKRMIFPTRDYKKVCVGISGRALLENQKPKYKHYVGFKKEHFLYGESMIEAGWIKGRGYLVEGFFDVIFLSRTMKNVLATMGTSISEFQVKKLSQWFNEVVLIPDMDVQGLKGFAEIAKQIFLKGIKVGVAGVRPVNYDNKLISYTFEAIEGLKDKDPGDFTSEELKKALDSIVWFKVGGGVEGSNL